jgi:hypothetical protein
MIGPRAAEYAVGLMSLKSRIASAIDRLSGYLGLFLIGLIGWYCDRFGSPGPAERPARHVDSGVRQVGRFVE